MKRNFTFALLCFVGMMVSAACDFGGLMDMENLDNKENPDFGDDESGEGEDNGDSGSSGTEEDTYIDLHKLKSYMELEMSELYEQHPSGVFEFRIGTSDDDFLRADNWGIAKAGDGSIGYYTSHYGNYPKLELAEGESLHHLSIWDKDKNPDLVFEHHEQLIGTDMIETIIGYDYEQDDDYEIKDIETELKIASFGAAYRITTAYFLKFYNAYRDFGQKDRLVNEGSETIAGIPVTKYVDRERADYVTFVMEAVTEYYIDADGNCLKYDVNVSRDGGVTFQGLYRYELFERSEATSCDNIVKACYPHVNGLDGIFKNTHTLYNGGWPTEMYCSTTSLDGLYDWNICYENLTVEDIIPKFTASGTVKSLKVSRDLHGFFGGVFSIEAQIQGPCKDDIRTYCHQIGSLPCQDSYPDIPVPFYGEIPIEGLSSEVIMGKYWSGEAMSWHEERFTFGDTYHSLRYQVEYYPADYDIWPDLLKIKIEIFRIGIV